MDDGAGPLVIEIAGVIQSACPPGFAEDLVGPVFVFMVNTLDKQQIPQNFPAVQFVADADNEIGGQEPEETVFSFKYCRLGGDRPGLLGGFGFFRVDRVAFGDIGIRILQGAQHHLDKPQIQPVVAVGKTDIPAGGFFQTEVPGIGQSAVCFVESFDPVVPGLPEVAKGAGSVRGAVIHQDDLDVFVSLSGQTGDTAIQVLRHIVYRNDDGNQILHLRYLLSLGLSVQAQKPLSCQCTGIIPREGVKSR